MAEEKGQERTETATPRRREKAREEGQVARSVEVASVLVLIAGMLGLAAFGARMTETTGNLLRASLAGIGDVSLSEASAAGMAVSVTRTLGGILAPFVALVALAGLGAHLAQVGVLITLKPLQPKFDRMSPASGIKRIFSKRGGMELAKSILKLMIVGAIVSWTMLSAADELLPLMSVGLFPGFQAVLGVMFRMGAAGALALGILAILDLFFQRWDHEQQLRMTRQEVREEMKQSEGDPQMKAKVRSRQMDMSRRRMMQDLKSADVVVTNPIRFAVALKYDSASMRAPRVVAKGARLLARRIRRIARENGIPVVQDPPLARALFKGCKVGQDIPLTLYKAVAELLAFVYRRDGAAAGAS
jgi:flagellar biosynthetic protein FlhB